MYYISCRFQVFHLCWQDCVQSVGPLWSLFRPPTMIILSMHNSGRHKLHTQPAEEALFEDVVTWQCDPTLWEGQEWLRSHWAELQLNTQSRQHLTRVLLRSAAPTTQTPSGWAARWEVNTINCLCLYINTFILDLWLSLLLSRDDCRQLMSVTVSYVCY